MADNFVKLKIEKDLSRLKTAIYSMKANLSSRLDRPGVLAILGCELCYIWSYNPEMESTLVIQILRTEESGPLTQTLRLESTPFMGSHLLLEAWIRTMEGEGVHSLSACPSCQHIHPVTGSGACCPLLPDSSYTKDSWDSQT